MLSYTIMLVQIPRNLVLAEAVDLPSENLFG